MHNFLNSLLSRALQIKPITSAAIKDKVNKLNKLPTIGYLDKYLIINKIITTTMQIYTFYRLTIKFSMKTSIIFTNLKVFYYDNKPLTRQI